MFNLEKSIENWKKSAKKNGSFEDGHIFEIETHLREKIQSLMTTGLNEQEAFSRAVVDFGEIKEVGREITKNKTAHVSAVRSMFFLLFPGYLKITFRRMFREKTFTFLNIAGLSVGIAAGLLILFYVNFERSYDNFHHETENIYRLTYFRGAIGGTSVHFASCAPPAGPAIVQEIPEVEVLTRLSARKVIVSRGEKRFLEKKIYFAETNFFNVFNFPLLSGKADLDNPYTAILTESAARKYFGDENPLGQVLTVNNAEDYMITGVCRDVPSNSHFKFDILCSYPTFFKLRGDEYHKAWGHTGVYTYVRMKQGSDMDVFRKKLAVIVDAGFGEALKAYNMEMELVLQKIRDIHLNSHLLQEFEENGKKDVVQFLFIISFFIIFIAWVNYVNLATARAMTRAKEMGLRKTLGAGRRQLMTQVLTESMTINIISTIIGCLLIELVLPYFKNMAGIPQNVGFWQNEILIAVLILIGVTGTVISGLYPAFVMSSANPVTSLKEAILKLPGKVNIRKGLVFVQLFTAFILIAGTITVTKQMIFMKNQDKGVAVNDRIAVQAPVIRKKEYIENSDAFRQELRRVPGVIDGGFVSEVPGRQIYWDAGAIYRAGQDDGKGKNYMIVGMDDRYIELFDLTLLHGRGFTGSPSDSENLILNETAVSWLGFESPESAINEKISYWGQIFTVIGVIKDFHQQSVKSEIDPTIFRYMTAGRGYYPVKLGEKNKKDTIKSVEKLYKEFFPGNTFTYFYIKPYYDEQYQSDEKFGQVFGMFSVLSLLITCLGLFGLALFSVSKRSKEIGVKKVLGATTIGIFGDMVKEYLILTFFASLFAVPVLYYGIHFWLNHFAVRMSVTADLFLLPLALVLVVTFVSVAWQTFRSVRGNPVDALRYE